MSNEYNFSFNLETGDFESSPLPVPNLSAHHNEISKLFQLNALLYVNLAIYEASLRKVFGDESLFLFDKITDKMRNKEDATPQINMFIAEINRLVDLDRENSVMEEIDRMERLCNNVSDE